MPMTLVTAIETDHIPGQQSPHQSGEGNFTRPQQKVRMILKKCPGIAFRLCSQQKISKPLKKILPIAIILKDLSAFNTSDDNMMNNSWSVQAS